MPHATTKTRPRPARGLTAAALLGVLLGGVLLGACGQVGPDPQPAPPEPEPPGDVLWFTDHSEGDLSAWSRDGCGGAFVDAGATAVADTSVARGGGYAAALTIRDVAGDQGARLFRWCESRAYDELHYSAWFYLPQAHRAVAGWWNVMQIKSRTGDGRNDPFFIVNVGDDAEGEMRVYLFDWQERVSYTQSIATMPVGRWVHLEWRYRAAGDDSGSLTLWQDGVQLFDLSGVRTRYPDGNAEWSINNSAAAIEPDPATIHVDDVAIARVRLGPDTDVGASWRARAAAAARP